MLVRGEHQSKSRPDGEPAFWFHLGLLAALVAGADAIGRHAWFVASLAAFVSALCALFLVRARIAS